MSGSAATDHTPSGIATVGASSRQPERRRALQVRASNAATSASMNSGTNSVPVTGSRSIQYGSLPVWMVGERRAQPEASPAWQSRMSTAEIVSDPRVAHEQRAGGLVDLITRFELGKAPTWIVGRVWAHPVVS